MNWNKGIELIKKYEGIRLQAYKCPAGVWTIGYGHTKGVTQGMVITKAQADNFLYDDLAKFTTKVMKYDSKYHWTENQANALLSFAFNIGSIDQLTANGTRDIATISRKIPEYRKAGGKVLSGLVTRRAEEKALFDRK